MHNSLGWVSSLLLGSAVMGLPPFKPSGQAHYATFFLQIMEQLYCCDLVPTALLVRASWLTGRCSLGLGRRGY